MHTQTDRTYMSRALQLAERGVYTTAPNPRVGCVLVRNDKIVGEGWHIRAGAEHAEVNALKQAGDQAQGATAYVSLEPCSHFGRTAPCSEALIKAGVKRVVSAMQDPNPLVAGKGLSQLRAAGIEVSDGLLQAQAEYLNRGYIKRMRTGLPWVICKQAMSLDGRTAMASGESQWITGEAARRQVHQLRARSGAVMTGIGTVLADDPALNVRLDADEPPGGWMMPARVVLDPQLKTPPNARLLQQQGRVIIVTASNDAHKAALLQEQGAEVMQLGAADGRVDLAALLSFLGQQQMNDVLLEAGATLTGAMLQAGLIDELKIYMAAHLMGHQARGLFDLPGLDKMDQRIDLNISDIRAVGNDWCISATVTERS